MSADDKEAGLQSMLTSVLGNKVVAINRVGISDQADAQSNVTEDLMRPSLGLARRGR